MRHKKDEHEEKHKRNEDRPQHDKLDKGHHGPETSMSSI